MELALSLILFEEPGVKRKTAGNPQALKAGVIVSIEGKVQCSEVLNQSRVLHVPE